MSQVTITKIGPPLNNDCTPEFGRTEDVRRLFGIKRGTLYNLYQQRKIRGVLLRQRGQQTGIRLWDIHSIREYIRSEMEVAYAE